MIKIKLYAIIAGLAFAILLLVMDGRLKMIKFFASILKSYIASVPL
jgi:hypothetical protein